MEDLPNGAEKLGLWLGLTMEKRSVTARWIAGELEVNSSTVSRWRKGQGTPNLDTTLRLARLFNEDPMRLAVTAGLVDGDLINVEPLSLPFTWARREAFRDLLVRTLTSPEVNVLMAEYDRFNGISISGDDPS